MKEEGSAADRSLASATSVAAPTAFLLSHVLITIGGVSDAGSLCLVYCNSVGYYSSFAGDALLLAI